MGMRWPTRKIQFGHCHFLLSGFDQALGRYPHEEPSSPTSDYAETVTERPSRCKHFDVVVDLFVGVVTGFEAVDSAE